MVEVGGISLLFSSLLLLRVLTVVFLRSEPVGAVVRAGFSFFPFSLSLSKFFFEAPILRSFDPPILRSSNEDETIFTAVKIGRDAIRADL